MNNMEIKIIVEGVKVKREIVCRKLMTTLCLELRPLEQSIVESLKGVKNPAFIIEAPKSLHEQILTELGLGTIHRELKIVDNYGSNRKSSSSLCVDGVMIADVSISNKSKFLSNIVDHYGIEELKVMVKNWSWRDFDKIFGSTISSIARRVKQQTPKSWKKLESLFIPEIGTEFRLEADFTATIPNETRQCLLSHFNIRLDYGYGEDRFTYHAITLKSGSILRVSRIYIRKGKSDYSSLTFNFIGQATVGGVTKEIVKGGQFWIHLCDVNKLNVSVNSNIEE